MHKDPNCNSSEQLLCKNAFQVPSFPKQDQAPKHSAKKFGLPQSSDLVGGGRVCCGCVCLDVCAVSCPEGLYAVLHNGRGFNTIKNDVSREAAE